MKLGLTGDGPDQEIQTNGRLASGLKEACSGCRRTRPRVDSPGVTGELRVLNSTDRSDFPDSSAIAEFRTLCPVRFWRRTVYTKSRIARHFVPLSCDPANGAHGTGHGDRCSQSRFQNRSVAGFGLEILPNERGPGDRFSRDRKRQNIDDSG